MASPAVSRRSRKFVLTHRSEAVLTSKFTIVGTLILASILQACISSHAGGFGAKPDHRSDGKHDEKRQHNKLREFEWRFGLRRSHGIQRRNFFKRLDDENE